MDNPLPEDIEAIGQAKMKAIVVWYKTAFDEEYKAFVDQNKIRQQSTYDEYGSAEQAGVAEMRHIHEIPDNMWKQVVEILDPEEMKWFTTQSGSYWFADEFPEFRVAAKHK